MQVSAVRLEKNTQLLLHVTIYSLQSDWCKSKELHKVLQPSFIMQQKIQFLLFRCEKRVSDGGCRPSIS